MSEPIEYHPVKLQGDIFYSQIEYDATSEGADSMFVHHTCHQAMIEIDEVVRKYAKIIPLRLRGAFEALIADVRLKPLGERHFATTTGVPCLYGDEAYAKAARLLAAGCDLTKETLDNA